jgi:hypothetical protein
MANLKVKIAKQEKIFSYDWLIENEDEGLVFTSENIIYLSIAKYTQSGMKTLFLLNLQNFTILDKEQAKDKEFTHIECTNMVLS